MGKFKIAKSIVSLYLKAEFGDMQFSEGFRQLLNRSYASGDLAELKKHYFAKFSADLFRARVLAMANNQSGKEGEGAIICLWEKSEAIK